MRQNDIFNLISPAGPHPSSADSHWDQEGSHPTNPTGDPIPQIPPPKRSRPYRCSRTTDILMSGCWRYWDRYDNNSGSRQTAAEGGSFASVDTYVMMSIRNLCLYRMYNLYVKPHMYSFTKNVYFWHMI